ncbi:mandelate racemase/muconate lactonizing enzyme family protein [Neptunomonas phycophila]|uniref:mandelate racemase/muconate lactonizing enzyme family protein n=1 Tax=Neptunomonas phycophila TaxID=1572645 RepID=UPI001BEBD6F8|nr:mandelate racemase/muconate lactonizing enzyme family protein [Neptunomonas phycophila]MBT3144884.1 mandelate racemase/muconate lactonizing enzyme family protein [Neptunomonas phycophila]
MQIASIHTHLLSQPLDQPFESATMSFTTRQHLIVEIRCDNGLIGWGECLGHADINQAIVKAMAPSLVGKNPLDIERHWLMLYNQFRDQGQRGAIINAISGLDIALWDIAGHFYQQPISQLMGGAFRSHVTAYATGGFRVLGKERSTSLGEEVHGFIEAGFKAIKIKIGFGLEDDLRDIAAVRDIIGPDISLMIDANHGYDALAAAKLGREASQFNIDWFEEPVVPEALNSYSALRTSQPIPIAGGETWHTRWGIATALQQGCVDIIQPDICGVGGLSEVRKILTLCDIYDVRCVPHVWGTGIALAAALQLHAILPPSPPSCGSSAALLEFDQTPNPFRSSILTTSIDHKDGIVEVPQGPGLGVNIDREALASFTKIPS